MATNKNIIAVVGMCGSGKTEAVKYIQEKFHWPNVYLGEATFDRIKREGLTTNYKNEKLVREKTRAELGMGAYAILALPKIKSILETNENILIESMYSWDEYKIFKNEFGDNFKVIAVFASPQVRFLRLNNRDNERPIKDIETFEKRDYSEIEGTDKGGPIARADFTIINEAEVGELHHKIDQIIISL
jgi:dephospho-CoA kinase